MFPDRYFAARFFPNRYFPPSADGAPPVVVEQTVGGHFLPEYHQERKRPDLRKEVRKAVNKAMREVRGEVERVEESTGVPIIVPVAAELRDRLAQMLGDTPDYQTPIEAARQLVIELIAEQNRRDEDEAMFIITALGA